MSNTAIMTDLYLQRIPDQVHKKMLHLFKKKYHFQNGKAEGGRMCLSGYFVGVSRSLANQFLQFIKQTNDQYHKQQFPKMVLPNGFVACQQNLNSYEKTGGFSFGSYDMAISEQGLQNIEIQAIATYPITTAKLNCLLQQEMGLPNTSPFAEKTTKNWQHFKNLYRKIFMDGGEERIILTDRHIHTQKTRFEFYATQQELGLSVDMVDTFDIFEKNQALYHRNTLGKAEKIYRLYNRVLPSEAIAEDNYPSSKNGWNFRYDSPYTNLTYINHPDRVLDYSKRLLPFIQHPFNPPSYELAEVIDQFYKGNLPYKDFVWKNKIGAAGFDLILSPNEKVLKKLQQSNTLQYYIAQNKVNYQKFYTDDGYEKIVELRFMTAHYFNEQITVPMARIGHITKNAQGDEMYKIHFGDNNKAGYGFAPVLIFED